MKFYFLIIRYSILSLLIIGCGESASEKAKKKRQESSSSSSPKSQPIFTLLGPDQTGVWFNNVLEESWSDNIFNYDYMYNGGGVGLGDINNDGLVDICFTGNMVQNYIYLNKGNMRFEDITEKSGFGKNGGWGMGVTMEDVNDDGFLDIYICQSYFVDDPELRRNQLWINNGDLTFTESAKEYGLDDPSFSVQASFFDYDRDGRVDMYLSNHMVDFRSSWVERGKTERGPYNSDKLFHNEGNGTFKDVSKTAGIINYACGLGLTTGDMNDDGWPDIYIANDYEEPDLYYVNNGDGTFTESLEKYFKHTSFYGMGTALEDVNNDGLPDLIELDMVAEDNYRQKTMMASMSVDKFWLMVNEGFQYQYMRNSLQINNGVGNYSEIGYLSGIANTDWSWAPLVADFDNDGFKDIYVTNGFRRDSRNKDAVHKIDDFVEEHGGRMIVEYVDSMLNMFPSQKIVNYYYQNNGDMTFTKRSDEQGIRTPSFSNGAAYADLDNDGDLDIVVNNILDPAFIYRNGTSERPGSHYLQVKLEGQKGNARGIGAKVRIYYSDTEQYQECMVTRGYLSCVDNTLHFGLGASNSIDELVVEWPNGNVHKIKGIAADQVLTLEEKNSVTFKKKNKDLNPIFTEVNNDAGIEHRHIENDHDDYATEILLPHKLSQFGPALAVGDINNDNREDVFIGGAKGQAGKLFIQKENGTFYSSNDQPFSQDLEQEDVGALFFDADNDKDIDLVVVSGGNEFPENSPLYQDRLYLNDGQGHFEHSVDMLPEILASGSCVIAADHDNDGDNDLFIGGRVLPGKYPFAPRSYMLRNDGGRFTDVTAEIAPGLLEPGLVTSAVWTDFNGDGALDLIVVGEWMPITLFQNSGGTFINVTSEYSLNNTTGWWNRIVAKDLDNDGDDDYILGNLGLNYKYKATEDEPLDIYCHDLDESGTLDIVLGYYDQGISYPVRGKQCTSEQMPGIKDKFPTYDAFGRATLFEVYGDKLNDALHYQSKYFSSAWIENKGNGQLIVNALPQEAQFSTVNGIVADDFNNDGHVDILLAGNFYMSEVETGRADASIGLLLTGNGNGQFTPIPASESGFFADLDVRQILPIAQPNGIQPMIIVANNNDKVQLFRRNPLNVP